MLLWNYRRPGIPAQRGLALRILRSWQWRGEIGTVNPEQLKLLKDFCICFPCPFCCLSVLCIELGVSLSVNFQVQFKICPGVGFAYLRPSSSLIVVCLWLVEVFSRYYSTGFEIVPFPVVISAWEKVLNVLCIMYSDVDCW